MLEKGIKGLQQVKVTADNTALAMGSGTLEVFATPSMIALMEKTAWKSVAPYLEEGEGTVGTQLDVAHLSATPLDMTVRCESELVEVDGRKLVFKVSAYDEAGLIGEGTHERFIVKNEKFQSKANGKKAK
ncbi:thioesterase family protein [Anaerovoracaceae bacterium 42-11]